MNESWNDRLYNRFHFILFVGIRSGFQLIWIQSQGIHLIVKRVSWFKSSLLLRIQIKYTNELQFLIKTKSSIFNRKVYTIDEKRVPSVACLGLIETYSILIKEKRKHLSKMSDRVSRNVLERKRSKFELRKFHRSICR